MILGGDSEGVILGEVILGRGDSQEVILGGDSGKLGGDLGGDSEVWETRELVLGDDSEQVILGGFLGGGLKECPGG